MHSFNRQPHKRLTSQASVVQEPGLKSWAFRRLHAQLTAPWEAHSVLFQAIAASSTGKPPAPVCGLDIASSSGHARMSQWHKIRQSCAIRQRTLKPGMLPRPTSYTGGVIA